MPLPFQFESRLVSFRSLEQYFQKIQRREIANALINLLCRTITTCQMIFPQQYFCCARRKSF